MKTNKINYKSVLMIALVALSTIIFTNSAQAVPTIGRPGCPYNMEVGPGVYQVIFYNCWNCPLQPGGLGCFGDCASRCNDAVIMQETDVEGVYLVTVYHVDTPPTTFHSDGWTETTIDIGGNPGTQMVFEVYEP